MSNSENTKIEEMKKEFIDEGISLLKKDRNGYGVEEDLYHLGVIIRRLKNKGVDLRIVNDTIINSLEYRELSYLASDIESFLRSKKW